MLNKDRRCWSHHMLGDAGALPENKVNTLMTPPSRCTVLGRVNPELVGLSGKTITRNAMRRLRFVVIATGWLHGQRIVIQVVIMVWLPTATSKPCNIMQQQSFHCKLPMGRTLTMVWS